MTGSRVPKAYITELVDDLNIDMLHVPRIRRYAQNNKRSCEEVRKLYEGSAADSNLFLLHRIYQ